jgi:hypothetical protein
MKLIKRMIAKSIDKIDLVCSIIVIPPAYLLKMYRLAGSRKMPRTTIRLEKIGVFPITNHYYEPLFDTRDLESRLIDPARKLTGINLDIDVQVKFLKDLNFREEILAESWNVKKDKSPSDFFLPNGAFESGDAEFLYQVIRSFKPKTIIEIGSGHSTRIAQAAISKNYSETATKTRHICVEPYEHAWLDSMENIEIVRDKIEKFDFEWDTLKENDFVFIDSSHVIRPHGDVLKLYLEIIPLLPAGVIVHIHDIFTPRDYLKEWIVRDKRFWNEQYLLEVMLQNSSRYEILAALNFLKHERYDELQEVCPYLTPEREPGSIYIKVR